MSKSQAAALRFRIVLLGALLLGLTKPVIAIDDNLYSENFLRETRSPERIADFFVRIATEDWSDPEQFLNKLPLRYQSTVLKDRNNRVSVHFEGTFVSGSFVRTLLAHAFQDTNTVLVRLEFDPSVIALPCVRYDKLMKRFEATGFRREIVRSPPPPARPLRSWFEDALDTQTERRIIDPAPTSNGCIGSFSLIYKLKKGVVILKSVEADGRGRP